MSEQIAALNLYNVDCSCITDVAIVYCAVRTEILRKRDKFNLLKG